MRKFKFRAWYEKEKLLGIVEFLNFEFQNVTFRIHDFYRDNIDLDKVKLMQYTGLKDCKGTEIYEDDIVKFYDIRYTKFMIGKIRFNTERGRWTIYPNVSQGRDLTAEKASQCEVIGNIHENLELLKC